MSTVPVEIDARRSNPRLPVRPLREPLTRSERDVAQLVAGGLRNAEIGDRLSIATRTVECHLSRIYQKLGIRSRTELVIELGPRLPAAPAVERCWRCDAHLVPGSAAG